MRRRKQKNFIEKILTVAIIIMFTWQPILAKGKYSDIYLRKEEELVKSSSRNNQINTVTSVRNKDKSINKTNNEKSAPKYFAAKNTVEVQHIDANISSVNTNTVVQTVADTTPPSAPSQLVVAANTCTSITIKWNAATDDVKVTSYDIYNGNNKLVSTALTTYTFTGLKPNSNYSFTVKARDAAGNTSPASNTLIAPTLADTVAPSIPQGLTCTSVSYVSAILRWTASTDNVGVVGYDIYDGTTKLASTTSTTPTYTVNGLKPNSNHQFSVYARDNAGNKSQASTTISVTTLLDNQPPSAPSGLNVTSNTCTAITLSWVASSDNGLVGAYEVYSDGIKIGETKGETNYKVIGLYPNTAHSYYVIAKDTADNVSQSSSSILVTTISDTAAPIAPSNLIVTERDCTSISISWTASTDNVGVSGYDVYANGRLVGQTTGDTNIKIQGLVPNSTYNIYVKARDNGGNISVSSKTLSATTDIDTIPPEAPVMLATVASTSSVTLSWNKATDNIAVTGYDIYRNGVKVGSTVDSITSYLDVGLAPDTEYKYTVRAKDKANNLSIDSNEVSAITETDGIPPTNPSNLKVTSRTGWRVGLSWTASTDNGVLAGYDIYCNGSKIGSSTTNSYNCKNLQLNTRYSFTVRARDLGNNVSGESNTVNTYTYNDDYGDDIFSAETIEVAKLKSGSINYSGDYDYFTFIAPSSSSYKITSLSSIDTYGYIYDENGNLITQNDDGGDDNNFQISTDLALGHRYYVAIKSYAANGDYKLIISYEEYEKPTAPADLILINKSLQSVSLSWKPSTDNVAVIGYEIYRDGTRIATVTDDITSYIDTSLATGTEYKYVVKAKDQAGNISDDSNELSVTTDSDNIAPTIPSNFMSTVVRGWSVDLTWNPSTDNVSISQYDVYCDGNKIGTTTLNYYTCKGLKQNTKYNFTIRAVDLSGNVSDLSNVVTVTTCNDDYGDDFDNAANVEAFKIKSGNIYNYWDGDYFAFTVPKSGLYTIKLVNEAGVRLYLYDNYKNIISSSNQSIDAPLSYGQRYYLEFCSNGVTAVSNYSFLIMTPEIEKPTIPCNLSVIDKSTNSISISWEPSYDDVAMLGYEIYRDGIKIASVEDTVMNYKDTGLMPNTNYKYTVRAKDQAYNLSDASNEVSETTNIDITAPTSPVNLMCAFTCGWSVNLFWNASTDDSGVAGYEIYCNGIKIGTTTSLSYKCDGLELNTKYSFTVRAVDLSGNMSDYSNMITTTTRNDDYGDNFNTAKTIEVFKNILGNINFYWDSDYFTFIAPKDGVYSIKMSDGTNDALALYDRDHNFLVSNDKAPIVISLKAGEQYYLVVSYVSSAHTMNYDFIVSIPEKEQPTSPTNLSIEDKTKHSVSISWLPSTDNVAVTGYEIYRNGVKISVISNDSTSYTDCGLSPDTEYIYTIKAKDQADNLSDFSNSVRTTTDSDVLSNDGKIGLNLLSKSINYVSLSWTTDLDNIDIATYDLYRDDIKIATVAKEVTSYIDTELPSNTSYTYRIEARDELDKLLQESNELYVTTDIV